MRPLAYPTSSMLPLLLVLLVPPGGLEGQRRPPIGRKAAVEMRFPDLRFDPPRAERHELSSGVPVVYLRDSSLPLVSFYVRFRGGYSLLPRELYAAASALPSLLRTGGTETLPPDSVDFLLDYHALQMSFGGGGESAFSSLNTLTRHLEPALRLWGKMLGEPRFDSLEAEIWRGRQLESIRRRQDDPGRLAIGEFNRIMFGDHPIGWDFTEEDLGPDRFSVGALQAAHRRIVCPEHLVMGVVGDVEWSEVRPLLEEMVGSWEGCSEPLLDPRVPEMRREGGVFLIPRKLTQSTVVLAEPGGISQSADPEYFASRIGNAILGASGFTSRLLTRVRTEAGYAYSASSLWTTPSRHEGLVGAITRTKSGSTIAAIRLILEIFQEMRTVPPEQEEVQRAIDQMVNGFVFNFQDPSQIVARQIVYQVQGLPEDWLQRYIEGIQEVRGTEVQQVFFRNLDLDEMVILILGDPEDFDLPPETLGPVQIWDPGDENRGRGSADSDVKGRDPSAQIPPLRLPEPGLSHHLRQPGGPGELLH